MTAQQAFDHHHQSVYRFVDRLAGRPDFAEDITQDCFLALLRHPQRWDAARGGIRTYLFSIARNLALGFFVQAAALASLFLLTKPIKHQVSVTKWDPIVILNPYQPKTSAMQNSSGGGGGGQRSPTPAARGAAPKFAPKQFIPPAAAVANSQTRRHTNHHRPRARNPSRQLRRPAQQTQRHLLGLDEKAVQAVQHWRFRPGHAT